MDSLISRAAAAALSCARAQGLDAHEARILAEASNTIVELVPLPVVARVGSGTGLVREGTAWLRREVEVCSYLGAAGAPCIAPSGRVPPGPHEHEGFAISFWNREEPIAEQIGPREAGALLRRCQEALEAYEAALPELGVITETLWLADHPLVAERLDEDERALLQRGAELLHTRLAAAALPLRPVHGDAHPGNMLCTASGPLLIDWEDCFAGPVEWDLACLIGGMLVMGDEDAARLALGAYGAPYDRDCLELMLEVRNLQAIVWGALRLEAPRTNPRWCARFRQLRSRALA